jgi:TonB-linked SusC/RagA family outer membrane protein
MKQFSLVLAMLFFVLGSAFAQKDISGTVTDEGGEPLIGANVIVKGTTTGVSTDFDGNYSIKANEGDVLEFSYTGYTTQEQTVGASSTINVTMAEGITLTEAVVTALGPRRNSREVVYANQTVKGDDLLSTPNKNTIEALRGKTAGVKIVTGSGSVGASSKIILRGEASLTGNNNALIVVDGVPIDNSASAGGSGGGESGYSDYGNRFNDINPEDIESVTVLKGPSATSLYGSRGASGVLLVTTKSGKSGKMRVNINSTASVDKAYVLLQRQNQFGQGLINRDGSNTFDTGENFSWGPHVDGVVRPWTSPLDIDGDGQLEYLSRPYSAVENQLQNFFRLGSSNTNNISLSGGNNAITYYASYGNTFQKGTLDNTDYTRHNLVVNTTANLSERLKTSFGFNYSNIDQNTASEGSRAFEGNNAYASAVQSPITIPFNELRDYNSPFHSFTGFYGSYTVNPYFVLNEYKNNGKIDNFLSNFSVSYDILKNLTIGTKLGMNFVNTQIEEVVPKYAYADQYYWEDYLTINPRTGRQTNAGAYLWTNNKRITYDWTSNATYNTFFGATDKYKLTTTVGFNLFDRRGRWQSASTNGGLLVDGVYNLSNSVALPIADQDRFNYRIMGLYGNAIFSLDNKAFLEYSIRNDWSSTLPVDNQSFLYQSIGASAVLSDYLGLTDNEYMDYLKVRTSFGTTGKDAPLSVLSSIFAGNPTMLGFGGEFDVKFPLNGQPGTTIGSRIGNPDLKPELTTTFEAGLDASFLKDKVSLEYTFYNSVHSNQIVVINLASSSGYGSTAVNIGEMTNKGHELALTLRPLAGISKDWHLEFNLAYSKNTNKVVKISDETNELIIYSSGRGVNLVAEEGQPFGTFKAQIPRYDPSGNPIVNSTTGLPEYTSNVFGIGNVQADWIGNLRVKVGYKGLTASALLDKKKGGDIFSLTKSATDFNGTGINTTYNDRKPFVITNSVNEVVDADGNVTGYVPNTTQTLIDALLFDGNYAKNVLDGSYLKLREITLSYNLPRSLVSKAKLSSASIGLFARNLKTWLSDDNTFADPEVNGPGLSTGNATGIETTQTPPSRSFGVSLNIGI